MKKSESPRGGHVLLCKNKASVPMSIVKKLQFIIGLILKRQEKDMERINYPNPQRIRKETVLLNGTWGFSYNGQDWQEITVPFCPESELSGIGNTDFIPKCYYKRKFLVDCTKTKQYITI